MKKDIFIASGENMSGSQEVFMQAQRGLTGCYKMAGQLACALIVFFVGITTAHAGGATLKDVAFASLPGGRFEVRMDFDSAPPKPAEYEIDKPARIVFDFAGVTNAVATKKFPLPFENAQSVVVLGSEDRTRLILNMTKLDLYQTRVDGNSLFIEVGSNKVQDVLTKQTNLADKVSSEVSQYGLSISNIDFRRGENGEGRILISLSDPAASINVEQTVGEIQLNFLDTQLPVNLRRRLDVTDFATPVLAVSSAYDGKDTRVSVKAQGDYDYMAYQTDNTYVVSVKRLTQKQLEEKKQKFTYVGDKLSLKFQDIPVRSVLQIIADFTELNLVASDTVDGTITLQLDNVPWDQALDLVLKTKGLDKRQTGNVLMVAPAAEIAEQERKQLETSKQLEELAPLRTEHIQILYAKAQDVFKLFGGKGGGGKGGIGTATGEDASKSSILSERGSAIVDERTNSIILTETENKIREFRELIQRIDKPVRQVSIEARVVRASSDYSKSLGARWGLDIADRAGTGNGIIRGTGGLLNTITRIPGATEPSEWELPMTPESAVAVDLAAVGATSQYTLGFFDQDTGTLVAVELSAMQESGEGQVVSQPRVVTQDQKEAYIRSGEEITFAVTGDDGDSEIVTKDAYLQLKVTPHITPDEKIFMKVEVSKDSVGAISESAVTIDRTGVRTDVMVNNGETVVLGGIYDDVVLNNVSKVPFLGDLPLIGRLFRQTQQVNSKLELLIFVTPRILADPLAQN